MILVRQSRARICSVLNSYKKGKKQAAGDEILAACFV